MSANRQWLDLGLDALPANRAQRVRVFRLLLHTSARLRGEMDKALAPTGVTVQQAAMLQFIEAQAAAPVMSQVAQGLRMSHQNVKQIARVLERKGFVCIAVDEADRRARRLVLTEHHHRFWRARNPSDFDGVARWTSGLTDAEVDALSGLLAKLGRGLRSNDTGDPKPEG